jgi:putative ABC transport system ATP-binding protein
VAEEAWARAGGGGFRGGRRRRDELRHEGRGLICRRVDSWLLDRLDADLADGGEGEHRGKRDDDWQDERGDCLGRASATGKRLGRSLASWQRAVLDWIYSTPPFFELDLRRGGALLKLTIRNYIIEALFARAVPRPIIQLKDVWKTYTLGEAKVHALRGLSLEVHPGDFLAIQGPSGSGKSTAMNLVGSLDVPTKGRIFLDGQDISALSESDLAQVRGRKIGFVFQKFNLIETLTALENVMLPMTFQGIPEERRKARARELLRQFGLGDRMDHKPGQLSGGQQQRVAIARALATDPPVILADEPTGNLDSATGRAVMDHLRELNDKQGKTIVLVTHEDSLARMADHIVRLKDGQVVKVERLRGA